MLRNARTVDGRSVDVAIGGAHVVAGASPNATSYDCGGRLLTPALADVHLHPDKAYLLEEVTTAESAGSVTDAIASVRARKPHETAAAIYARTVRLLEACLRYGTTAVRLHAEVDPLLGLRSVEAVLAARCAFAGRVHAQVVAFPQEGILREPGTADLLRSAMGMGADVVGGITYQDADKAAHLDVVCALARDLDCPLDLHADFCQPAGETALPLVAAKVRQYGLQGRTLVGHCTSLAKLPAAARDAIARELADSGVSLVALPRTDLFLDGVIAPLKALAANGLACFLATNNVQNPFTPVGEPSLPQVAQLYALAAGVATQADLDALACGLWESRALIGRPTNAVPQPGDPADLCLWDCEHPWQIVARGLVPRAVFSAGALLPPEA